LSYLYDISFFAEDFQILSSLDLFLFYRTDSTDSRSI